MRVLTLVPSQKGHSPGQRGSIELWEQVLARENIELVYAPFETDKLREILYQPGKRAAKVSEMVKGYIDRLGILKTLDDYDAVFVYREAALLGPAYLEKRIAKKKPIIYQLDDPLYMPYRSPANGYLSYLKFFGKIKEIIKVSKVVIVNSTHIYDYARQFNSNVWQIPSIVDTEKFVYNPEDQKTDRPCVGWSGSPTTLKNIKMIEKPLQAISSRADCDIHFIGGTDLNLTSVKYSAKKWNSESEVRDLRKIQIGLVPLPDVSWNKHKFIMKTAQYMALGIVPVATPMASNPEVIRHGENGFLASTDDEWVRYIDLLVTDHTLRQKMSSVGAADARSHYSLTANRDKIIQAFRAALS